MAHSNNSSSHIIDHPFLNDLFAAIESTSGKKLTEEMRLQLREANCEPFPGPFLKEHWEGWQMGLPRPAEMLYRELSETLEQGAFILLWDFFKKVEQGGLYCDNEFVIDKFGEPIEQCVKDKIGKTKGLHFNLAAAHWTFGIRFSDWIHQNMKHYDCSLVCFLDEKLARFDSRLRSAFFPTPGPYRTKPRQLKKLQKRILDRFAPRIKKELIKDFWAVP